MQKEVNVNCSEYFCWVKWLRISKKKSEFIFKFENAAKIYIFLGESFRWEGQNVAFNFNLQKM